MYYCSPPCFHIWFRFCNAVITRDTLYSEFMSQINVLVYEFLEVMDNLLALLKNPNPGYIRTLISPTKSFYFFTISNPSTLLIHVSKNSPHATTGRPCTKSGTNALTLVTATTQHKGWWELRVEYYFLWAWSAADCGGSLSGYKNSGS